MALKSDMAAPSGLPLPLCAAETGTFTEYSVLHRLPEIALRTLAENTFPARVAAGLEALILEIPDQPLALLQDGTAPDAPAWNQYLAAHAGATWREAPWFLIENYFYRRIIETTGYFKPGPGAGNDPFEYQKTAGLVVAQPAIETLAILLQSRLDAGWHPTAFLEMIAVSLWANQVDLSMWPADHAEKPDHGSMEQAESHLLVDDRTLAAALFTRPVHRVDFLCDNAGFELVCDLCLADYLLTTGQVEQVHLNVKAHPTFVSDALASDVENTIAALSAASHPAVRRTGERWARLLDSGRLVMRPDFFWNSPLALWEMPPALLAEFAPTTLVISKGDANYRRLLGDRHWDFTTPFQKILGYFPFPLLALRTLKSEIVAGLRPDQLPGSPGSPAAQDPNWLTDARWGVIQYAPGT